MELWAGIMLGRRDRRRSPRMAWYSSRVGEALRTMAHSTGQPLAKLARLAAQLLGALETWEVGLDADPEDGGRIVYCSEPNGSGWSTSDWKSAQVFVGAIDWLYRAAATEDRGLVDFAAEMVLRGLDSYRDELEDDEG